MTRFNRRTYSAASAAVLLIAAAILYADLYVAPATSAGTQTSGGSLVNVGQAAVGLATDGTVTARMGAIPIYAFSIGDTVLGDCTGNGRINLSDFRRFRDCFNGPGGGLGETCGCADLDGDLDVDMRDARRFMRRFGITGP